MNISATQIAVYHRILRSFGLLGRKRRGLAGRFHGSTIGGTCCIFGRRQVMDVTKGVVGAVLR